MNRRMIFILCPLLLFGSVSCTKQIAPAPTTGSVPVALAANDAPMADVHFHTKNFVQEGITLDQVIPILDDANVGRAAVFGIPLQQNWDMSTGVKPGYYLNDDQELYYYSAVDPFLALEYQTLSQEKRSRLDPMIVGFNPTDGRAVDHIRNMLLKFPGVFTGIGEFSVEKEIVSGKVAGRNANLNDPALDSILSFAAETGLAVLLHCDVDAIISGNKEEPTYLQEISELFARHRNTNIIWAHSGLGRFVKARPEHTSLVSKLLSRNPNLNIDISWDVVLNQLVDDNGVLKPEWKEFLTTYSGRILFGTDVVAPKSDDYGKLVARYRKVFDQLPERVAQNIRYENYGRIFDRSRKLVREWEQKQLAKAASGLKS